jgi:hypothetical protein
MPLIPPPTTLIYGAPMATRGSYQFDVRNDGHAVNNDGNLEKLRSLFLDKNIINNALGPGNSGDFDYGAWHVLCHLAAGCAVYKGATNGLLWLEISHVPEQDIYAATVTASSSSERTNTYPLDSNEASTQLASAKPLGFVEGSSLGHISARGVTDPPNRFNKWMRQDFDQNVLSRKDGGRVWEHWCTVRDIRKTSAIGTSVLRSYLALVSHCGGRFVALVARGRRDYDHPRQLKALVESGFIAKEDALLDIQPRKIPLVQELALYKSNPKDSLSAAEKLAWPESGLSYYMFSRRIDRWSSLALVKQDLASL